MTQLTTTADNVIDIFNSVIIVEWQSQPVLKINLAELMLALFFLRLSRGWDIIKHFLPVRDGKRKKAKTHLQMLRKRYVWNVRDLERKTFLWVLFCFVKVSSSNAEDNVTVEKLTGCADQLVAIGDYSIPPKLLCSFICIC